MTDREIVIAQGERARLLLQDPIISGALDTIREQTQALFFELRPEDSERMTKLVMLDRMRQQFVRVLTLLVNDAEVSKYELLDEQSTETRVREIERIARER